MRRLLAAVATAVMLLAAPAAHADPDPHIPNPQTGYCPGGGQEGYLGYCNGIKYPDGSYWHYIRYDEVFSDPLFPFQISESEATTWTMECMVENGPVPAPAPLGGCGGAVK